MKKGYYKKITTQVIGKKWIGNKIKEKIEYLPITILGIGPERTTRYAGLNATFQMVLIKHKDGKIEEVNSLNIFNF